MSFSVDQFMQVKCKFTITSESESETSESIYTNNEQVRLCKSIQLDSNNSSTLIVMICSNEVSNNHILVYYIEKPRNQQQTSVDGEQKVDDNNSSSAPSHSLSTNNYEFPASNTITPTNSTQLSNPALNHDPSTPSTSPASYRRRSRTKPKIIVKQIYYHNYNEDIVAICLNQSGTKLVLINASSTIYVIPIKNILLNLHARQLRSSQSGSMYYYDATILNPCSQDQRWSINEPIDMVYWESNEDKKSILVVANQNGKITFINVDEKREICSTSVGEPIKSLDIIRDGHGQSLLITCTSYKQYRQVLESSVIRERVDSSQNETQGLFHNQCPPSLISLSKQGLTEMKSDRRESLASIQSKNSDHMLNSKPIPVKLFSNQAGQATATRLIQRVFTPSASHLGIQTSLSFSNHRDHPVTLLRYQSPNLICSIDVLAPNNNQNHSSQQTKLSSSQSLHQPKLQNNHGEPRLLRYYSNKNYFYQPNGPQIIFKLDSLDPDELITDLILTDRFIAYTTDRDRCIINSRNCCKLKSSSTNSNSPRIESLNPLVKEIAFNHEEKIMLLIKSPISNDQDNIIDSFLLITTRSIYSIEARHNCRELFINLIDSHLAIKRTLFMSKTQIDCKQNHSDFNLDSQFTTMTSGYDTHRNAESDLLISNFLQHREVYERICHDSQAFSTLFKLELNSLYEAYADRLLQRGQLDLANRFFQMARFDHLKILGKYIRVCNYRGAINYVQSILSDEHESRKVMTENEKIEILKMAFKCLLAKTVVERGVGDKKKVMFDEQQKQIAENIFIEFLIACLDESTDDACRLWYNYINYYLNYIGNLDQLQVDILRIMDTVGDCRLAVSLYKTIYRDESSYATKSSINRNDGGKKSHFAHSTKNGLSHKLDSNNKTSLSTLASHWNDTMIMNTQLEKMEQLHTLANLFKNEFLMRLLERTLDLLPQSMDLDLLSIATMC